MGKKERTKEKPREQHVPLLLVVICRFMAFLFCLYLSRSGSFAALFTTRYFADDARSLSI